MPFPGAETALGGVSGLAVGNHPRFLAAAQTRGVRPAFDDYVWGVTESLLIANRFSFLSPLGLCLTLLGGRALAGGDLVEDAPLRLHPHVGITR